MYSNLIINHNEKRQINTTTPISEFYATAEVKEKYNVKDSWIFVVAKKHNIPRTFNRGKTYWSKKHIDNYFAKKAADPEITEWYTVPEIQEKLKANNSIEAVNFALRLGLLNR